MKKAAIYIRVSTVEQAKEGFSIGAQKDRLINYCKAKNWAIQDVYIDDGYTGTNTDRPALQSLLNALDDIDLVVVYKLDRLSRSQKDVLFLVEDKFLNNDIDFVSLVESFDTSTPFGRAMLGILAVFAQLERETIIERTKLGKEKRAKEGLWRGGGNQPYGYVYDEKLKRLIVDDYESIIVKEIFDLYLNGKGMNSIARTLDEKGYKTRVNTDWNMRQVRRILSNDTITGVVKYKDEVYEGLHEAIIDRDIFKEVQNMLNDKAKKGTATKYLLGGMLYCGHCGGRLRASWSTAGKKYKSKYYHYLCYSVVGAPQHMVKDKYCINKTWEMGKLDDLIVNELVKKSLDSKKLRKAYEYEQSKTNVISIDNSADILEKKIKDIDSNINKLMDLYQDDKIPIKIISERIEKLYNEKKDIENNLNKFLERDIVKKVSHIPFEQYMFWLENFEEIWNEAEFEEKKIILTSFIEKIIVSKDSVEVVWNDIS